MRIEHGIATQRLRLSRLVTGLLMVVAFVSVAPFSIAYRLWMREALLSILTRAEMAAQCLVMAQARVLAVQAGVCDRPARFAAALDGLHNPACLPDGALPSFRALRRRLKALRAVLGDLPRHAVRLLRRVLGTGTCPGWGRFIICREERPRAFRLGGYVIERPPDKVSLGVKKFFPSLPKPGGRRWQVRCTCTQVSAFS